MNLSIVTLIFVALVLEHQQIKFCLALKCIYYSGIGIWELVCTTYNTLLGHVHLKNQMATELFCQKSSIPNFLPQEIVQYQRVSLAFWQESRSALQILKRSSLQCKRRDICCVIKLRLDIFSQLIQLFVRLLVIYLLVIRRSEVVVVFKEVLFIMMPLLVWFELKIKSLQEVMIP